MAEIVWENGLPDCEAFIALIGTFGLVDVSFFLLVANPVRRLSL
jgi:hypothetical protein